MSIDAPDDLPDRRNGRSRYPGTRAFRDTPDDQALFFGRKAEIEELYLRVLSVPLLIQFGNSGLGKTSLLQAGLFPRLRAKAFFPVMVRLNDENENLTQAVARSIRQSCELEQQAVELSLGRTEGMGGLLSTTTVWRDDLLLTPVLVFDPFEEVFTRRSAEFRAELAAELGALASGRLPERLRPGSSELVKGLRRLKVKIVISLREDYLGALEEFSAAIPGLFNERLRLEPLSEGNAREAIVEPAKLLARPGEEPYWSPCFEFDADVLKRMIEYLKGASGVIEPFQLQLLCRHAEAIAHAKGGKTSNAVILSSADFTGQEDFASVLKNSYRDTLQKLPRSQRRKAAQLCEEGLLDASGHRLMLEEAQIRREFRIEPSTLDTLVRERLVRRERRLESVFYEISHDRLAESILQSRGFRLPRKVRRALLPVLILAPFVLAFAAYQIVSLHQARVRAETLLSFLLGEKFLGEVRDTGRSTMLELVGNQVRSYAETGDSSSSFNRGLALRNAGDLERTQGTLSKSLGFFEQALESFESSPHDLAKWHEVARTHERMAEALGDRNKVTQALSHAGAAILTWRRVISDPGDVTARVDDCVSLAGSLTLAAGLENRMGSARSALDRARGATEILSSVMFGRASTEPQCQAVVARAEPYLNDRAVAVLSRVAALRATILDRQEDYQGATYLASEASRLKPASSEAKRWAVGALANWSATIFDYAPRVTLSSFEAVADELERLRPLDLNNRVWQSERAQIQTVTGGAIMLCHIKKSKDVKCDYLPSLEEAGATVLEALATLRALAQIDPTNLGFHRTLAAALRFSANIRSARGSSPEETLELLEESEKAYSRSAPDAADTDISDTGGLLLSEKADVLKRLNRSDASEAALEKSVTLLRQLVAKHPDDPHFVDHLRTVLRSNIGAKAKNYNSGKIDDELKVLDKRYEELVGRDDEAAGKLERERLAHWNAGLGLFAGGDYRGALREFEGAEASIHRYISYKPVEYKAYDELRGIFQQIALTYQKLGKDHEQGAILVAALHSAQMAALLGGGEGDQVHENLSEARHRLGTFLYENKRFDDALIIAQEEVANAEKIARAARKGDKVDTNVKYANYLRLGNARYELGRVRREHQPKRVDGWEEAIRGGIIHMHAAADLIRNKPDVMKEIGQMHSYLAKQLEEDQRKDEAAAEYRLALAAYKTAAKLSRNDQESKEAIRQLADRGIR